MEQFLGYVSLHNIIDLFLVSRIEITVTNVAYSVLKSAPFGIWIGLEIVV